MTKQQELMVKSVCDKYEVTEYGMIVELTGETVAVKEGNIQKTGKVVKVDGQNVYVEYATRKGSEVGKFHKDSVKVIPMLANDVQARKWEKEHGFKAGLVPADKIWLRFSFGNAKLKDNAVVRFIQWNITAVTTCPWRTAMCEKSCYALKAERIYPTVRVRRALHTEFAKTSEFVPAMIEQIEYELSRKASQGKTIFFRIHESGDFVNMNYLNAWHEITKHFKGNRGIVFMAYTKSLPLVKALYKRVGKQNVNITFKASEWDDTKETMREMRKELGLSVFTALPVGELEKKGFFACPSSENAKKPQDCGECKMCYFAQKDTAIEIH